MTDQFDQSKNIYRKHLKPNWYVAKFGDSYLNFDLGYLGEIFLPSECEVAERALMEKICQTSAAPAKLLYANLRRFAQWLESENLSSGLGRSRDIGEDERIRHLDQAFDLYVTQSIGNARYIGRDVSALWRGLNLFRESGLPVAELKKPSEHAKERSHSISLRIGSTQILPTINALHLLHTQMAKMAPNDIAAVIAKISSRPELRNYCEIKQFTEELKKVARPDSLR